MNNPGQRFISNVRIKRGQAMARATPDLRNLSSTNTQ